MKNLRFVFFIFLSSLGIYALSGCQKDQEPSCGKESKQFDFFQNSHLDIQFPTTQTIYPSIQIVEGDTGKIVFQYFRFVDESGCPWSDGGQGDWIVFEVDEDLVEFNFEEEELTATNVMAGSYSGFVGGYLMQQVQTGTISGKKISQTEWDVTVDLTTASRTYKIEKKFKLQ